MPKINKIYKNILIFMIALVAFIGFSNSVEANTHNVTGWAWSDNIGWISMNSSDCDLNSDGSFGDAGAPAGCPTVGIAHDYGVSVDPNNGNFFGHAWSDNIGWVSFDVADTVQCGSGIAAKVDLATGGVIGYARALSGNTSESGSWTGCIKLSDGPTGQYFKSPDASGNKGVTFVSGSSSLVGYAWGDINVGWVKFNNVKVNLNAPLVDLQIKETANLSLPSKNITIVSPSGTTAVVLYISTKNVVSCTNTLVPPLGTSSIPTNTKWNTHQVSINTTNGTFAPDNIPKTPGVYTFNLACKDALGVVYRSSATATVVSGIPNLILEVGVPGYMTSPILTVNNLTSPVVPILSWTPSLMQMSPFIPSSSHIDTVWGSTVSRCTMSGNSPGESLPVPTVSTTYNYYLDCVGTDNLPYRATATLTLDPIIPIDPVIKITADNNGGTISNPFLVNSGYAPNIAWGPVSPTVLSSCKIGAGNTGYWFPGSIMQTKIVGDAITPTQGSFTSDPITKKITYAIECLDVNNQTAKDSVVIGVGIPICSDGITPTIPGPCPQIPTLCSDGITPTIPGPCPGGSTTTKPKFEEF